MEKRGKNHIAIRLLLLEQYLEAVCPEAAHKAEKSGDQGSGVVKIEKHILTGVAGRDVLLLRKK